MAKKQSEKQIKDQWWDKNYKRLIEFCTNTPHAHEMAGVCAEEDIQSFHDQTAKHQALWILSVMDIKELDELLEDYEIGDVD